MNWSDHPIILLGHGCRAAGADVAPLLELGVPVLTSWQAKDMVDNNHPNYFGSPGRYGQRMANKAMHNADMILAIGNRMSIWNVGYEGPRPDQRLVMVDIDETEVKKFPHAVWINQDAKQFIDLLFTRDAAKWDDNPDWRRQCAAWKAQYPLVESLAHDDLPGFINSYRFVDALHEHLRPDDVIVTDCGEVMCPVHQVLRLKPPQRLMTSGGLGEMGCALPAAFGASMALRDQGKDTEVICFVGDGGMMLNLSTLQSIVQHQCRIKIIVFENDGYGMISRTERKAGMELHNTNAATGVTLPSFRALAQTFGIPAADVRTWDDYKRAIPQLFYARGPALIEYHQHPDQPAVPTLVPIKMPDGTMRNPLFDELSPVLP